MRSLWLLSLGLVLAAVPALAQSDDSDWWKTAVFYQIYPRSFKDSDGDGVGDLQGAASKLRYLKTLGVDAVWMSPIFTSPMADFGYDIANFYEIDPLFGTMADFDAFVGEANVLGIKVIMDFVPNHSSDECEWFVKSVARDPEYENYYIWRDPIGVNATGSPIPPNDWMGQFFESVWTYVEERGQFYYHKYNFKQPDLNFREDKVRRELENVMLFWLDRGASGFRVDTVHTLVENDTFPAVPNEESNLYTSNQPLTYDIVKEWRVLLDNYEKLDNFTRVLMTEAYGTTEQVMAYYGNETNPGAHFTFNFNFINGLSNTSSAQDFENTITGWMTDMPAFATANWVIGNHDQHRVASRYGPDLAAGMAMLTLLLPGVGVVYNGEEIGMVNNWNISYEQTQDPQGVNAGPDGYLANSRDFERTPFQWDATNNAGFTTGDTTWLPIHENYIDLNLLAQQRLTPSFNNMYRSLLHARTFLTIQQGSLKTESLSDSIIAISRERANEVTFVVVVNLGATTETVSLNSTFPILPQEIIVMTANPASGLTTNSIVLSNEVTLAPFASVVFTDQFLPISGAITNKSGLFFSLCMCFISFARIL